MYPTGSVQPVKKTFCRLESSSKFHLATENSDDDIDDDDQNEFKVETSNKQRTAQRICCRYKQDL